MTEVERLFQQYRTGTAKDQDQAAKLLLQHPEATGFLLAQLETEHSRAALAMLGRAARRESIKQALIPHTGQILAFLQHTDAKTRKNAAILLGQLGRRETVAALSDALTAESQQFVRPSLILALGAIGGTAAREALQALPVPEGEDKNQHAERDARQKALSRLAPAENRRFTGFPAPRTVWLMPARGLTGSLLAEARERNIEVTQNGPLVQATTRNLPSLFQLRGFYEALMPFASQVPATPQAIAQAVADAGLFTELSAMHDGQGPFPTRLELRGGTADRGAFASSFFACLEDSEFTNAPSSYDIEIRAWIKENKATLAFRLYTLRDPRFEYRLSSVSASMHPAVAASLLFEHRHFMQPHHTILDPFCGAATLLIERRKLMGASAITGLDISPKAFTIARSNCHQAGLHAKIFQRDCRGFHSDSGFDEILCNLPFGHRVGTHDDNEQLYADILEQWHGLLRPKGFILAVTNDKQSFLAHAQKQRWRVVKQTNFWAGGLAPTAYLLQE